MKPSMQVGALAAATILSLSSSGSAHVSIASGPGFANTTQEITFGVGHGCDGKDTLSVRVELPPEVLSVRAERSDLGAPQIETDAAGVVTAVTWEKSSEELLSADTHYYKLTLRLKVPDQPFTTLYFPSYQTCLTEDGAAQTVEWIATDPEATDQEPAPALAILPKRFAGWNEFSVTEDITDLAQFFGDALIVWQGESAYSTNPSTAKPIASTPGVSELALIAAGDTVWVKY